MKNHETSDIEFSPKYHSDVKHAIILQLVVGLLLLLLLDGGAMARLGGLVMVGFWIGTMVIMGLRPKAPTSADIRYIKWGYLPLLLLTTCVLSILQVV